MKELSVIAILTVFICSSYVSIVTVNAEVNTSVGGEFTYLSNLQAYRVTFDGVKYNSTEMKMGNIEYHEGIQLSSSHSNEYYAYFNLNGTYNNLIGLVGLDDIGTNAAKVTLFFLGDDKELIKIDMVAGDLPVNINLDVSGVRRLTVKADHKHKASASHDASIDLVNMTLWKSAPAPVPIPSTTTVVPT